MGHQTMALIKTFSAMCRRHNVLKAPSLHASFGDNLDLKQGGWGLGGGGGGGGGVRAVT